MGGVSKDQLARARQLHVLDYVLSYESGEYKQVGIGYRNKNNMALAVDEQGWYCHRQQVGGRTALDYLVTIKGYGLVNAVCMLLGEHTQEHYGKAPVSAPKIISHSDPISNAPAPERQPLKLPIRNNDNSRIIAYLQSRGIDHDLIMNCINRGVLYESRYYHNAVFLGKNIHGKTKYASMRSTTMQFVCDADGSDKRYGFLIPPDNPHSNEVAVCESPIDCLSHQTLCKQGYLPPFDGWRLSLGCTSVMALEEFFACHPEVNHCLICTDADEAGEKAAAKILEMQGTTSERLIPAHGKDWNDTLQAVKKANRAQTVKNYERN